MRCLQHAHIGCLCPWREKVMYQRVTDQQLAEARSTLQELCKRVSVRFQKGYRQRQGVGALLPLDLLLAVHEHAQFAWHVAHEDAALAVAHMFESALLGCSTNAMPSDPPDADLSGTCCCRASQ